MTVFIGLHEIKHGAQFLAQHKHSVPEVVILDIPTCQRDQMECPLVSI